ncbi:MAG: element excision factor XisH family protein [Acidobacteriota bacterium]
MPRKDLYHDIVKEALVKDGWQITDDPFLIGFRGTLLFADLGAEKVVGVRNRRSKISIEVKVLSEPARFAKFECAVGQYVVYRRLMMSLQLQRDLYLAISYNVFTNFFQKRPAVMEVVNGEQIHLLIFDSRRKEIVQWIK